MKLTTDQIIDTVARHMELNVEDVLNKKTRKAEMVLCRHLIFYFMRKYTLIGNGHTPITYQTIGDMFKKHHASIMHAEKKVKSYIKFNSEFRQMVGNFEEYFYQMSEKTVCTHCGSVKV